MEFYQTNQGRIFFNSQLPKLIHAIEELTKTISNTRQGTPPSQLCHVCVNYNCGRFHVTCSDCINHEFYAFKHIDTLNGTRLNTKELI